MDLVGSGVIIASASPRAGNDAWQQVSPARTGMGVPYNVGARTLESTPAGLFLGTAGERRHGTEVYQSNGPDCDGPLPAPRRLRAARESEVGDTVLLEWEAVPGAARYRIYRSLLMSVRKPVSETTFEVPDPSGKKITVSIEDIRAGKLDHLCEDTVGDTTLCAAIGEIKKAALDADANSEAAAIVFPLAYQLVDVTTLTSFSEPAPLGGEGIYFVRAEDPWGNVSDPSNIVAAPSKATAQSAWIPDDIIVDPSNLDDSTSDAICRFFSALNEAFSGGGCFIASLRPAQD